MSDVVNPPVPPVAPGHLTLPPPLPRGAELAGPPPPRPGEENDPFRFGWRYVCRTLPDGSEVYDQIPLTWEDLLYPEEEDFVVQEPDHQRDYTYIHGALETMYRNDLSVVVLGDCRTDFSVAGLRPLGPDVVVFFDVREWFRNGTFEVAVEGGVPVVVFEVSSPSTRIHDLANKPDLYYRAGVQKYVIIDRGPNGTDPPRLIGYRRGPNSWLDLPADARGWIDLSPVRVFIGLEGDRPWLYDAATQKRLPDLTAATIAKEEAESKARGAESKAREAAQAQADAEAKARDAEAKAREEARARANAEAKAREEALTRTDAEAKARSAEARAREESQARANAETKAREEARARADAEAKAREEAKQRAAIEERLRELEQQLRDRQGPP